MFTLLGAAVLAASASPSPSSSPTPTPPPRIAHVVTSDRSNEALTRTTRVTYVVTHDQIVRNGYRTVSEALERVPGVQIEEQGAIGSLASFGIRGSSSSQVLVLLNGLPAPGMLSGSVDLGELSTSGVNRIEVVEGGGSTLYGADAVGGVINVITNGFPTQPSAAVRWGSFGDRQIQASAAGFSYERIVAANGYPIPSFTPAYGPPPAPFRDNSDYDATTARYDGSRTFGSIDATVDLGVAQGNLGVPGYYPFVSNTSRQMELDENAGLTLRVHGKRSSSTLQFGGTQQQIPYDCNEKIDSSCAQPSASLSLESRLDLDLRDSVDAGAQQIVYGVDLSRGTIATNTGGAAIPAIPPATPPPDRTADALAQSGAYVQDLVEIASATHAYVGIRAERDGSLGGALSPSIGFETAIGPTLSLKVNAAGAFRAPNASELYYPGYGNPDLVPERSRVADATLTDASLLGGTSIGWFVNATRNLIVPTLTDPSTCAKTYVCVYEPVNLDRTLIRGFTFDTRTPPYHGLRATLNATDLYTAEDLTGLTRLPNDPVMAVDLGLQIVAKPGGAFGGAGVSERVVGNRASVDPEQPLFFQAGAYADLTAYAQLNVAPRMQLFLRGYDLGNERYAQDAGYPMPGRSFALELRAR